MARKTSASRFDTRQEEQALAEALRNAFDPTALTDELMAVVKKFAMQVNAQADLAENLVLGLEGNLSTQELSRHLAADMDRSRQVGMSDRDIAELLEAIELGPDASAKLERSLAEMGRTLEMERIRDIERTREIDRDDWEMDL